MLVAVTIVMSRLRRHEGYSRKKGTPFPCIRAKAKVTGVEPFPAPFPKIGAAITSFLMIQRRLIWGSDLLHSSKQDDETRGPKVTRPPESSQAPLSSVEPPSTDTVESTVRFASQTS